MSDMERPIIGAFLTLETGFYRFDNCLSLQGLNQKATEMSLLFIFKCLNINPLCT